MEEPPSYHSIQVVNQTKLTFDLDPIESAVSLCLRMGDAEPSDVRILITDDEHVAELNQRFRNIAEPTDVLTFPDEFGSSGDIAIAAHYAARQASVRGIDFQDELVLLSIHGTLHLLGLDDETEPDRLYMVERMYDVAERLGMNRAPDWGSLLHQEPAR